MDIIKKGLVILVLYSIVVPDNLKLQLLKIPFLVQHYLHHNYHDHQNSVGIFDFITSHYNSSNENDSEHENLPFKHTDNSFQNASLVFTPTFITEIKFKSYRFSFYKPKLFTKNFSYIFSFLTSIWRPPKFEFKTVA